MSDQRDNRFFRGWATFVLRLRVLVIPLLLVVAVASALEARSSLQVETSPEYFARGSSDAFEKLEAFRETFGRDDQYMVLVRGDVFTRPFLDRLRTLHHVLETAQIDLDGVGAHAALAPPDGPARADVTSVADPGTDGLPTGGQGEARAATGEGWGEDDADAAGWGEAPAGDASDAAGWGEEPATASAGDASDAAGWGEDDADAAGWGEDDADAAGWGDAPGAVPAAEGTPAPVAATSPGSDDWGEGGGSVIEEVTSLVNFRQTVFEGGALRVRGLMDTDPTDLDAFRQEVLADPDIVGSVVGADGKHAVLVVRTALIGNDASRVVQDTLQDLVAPYSSKDFDIVVTGLPGLEHAVSGSLMRDMRVLIGVAFGLMALVLFIHFRHPVAVIAPLTVVGLSIVITLGVMAATGTPVTLLTNIVPAFLICVGLGDSVHVQSVYRDKLAHGQSRRDAILGAVGSTGMPVLFTTLTTMVGLLSFRSASTLGIQQLGMVAAFGVFVALWLSVTVIPLFAPLIGAPKATEAEVAARTGRRRDIIDKLLRVLTGLSAAKGGRRRVYLGTLVLTGVAALGISRIEVFHDPLTWLPTGHPIQTSIHELDEEVGGTSNVAVVIDAPGELGVKDRDLLERMDELITYVQAFEHPRTGKKIVGNAISIVGIVKEVNRALHEGDPGAYALPDTQRGVSDALLLFESAGPEDLRRVVTADLARTHITFRLDWMDATSLLPLDAYLRKGIDDIIGDSATATITGTAYSLVSTVGALIGDLIRSFGLAVFVIALMMAILLRAPKLAAISLVPNLLPVAFILGFMGFVGIPIDMATLLIASIVIGIAVDTTIHYLHQFRVVFLEDHDVEAGIRYALDHAGRALVSTSSILALGFAAYMASSMANVRRFGILVSVACIVALFTNLILVPTLLRSFYGGSNARR